MNAIASLGMPRPARLRQHGGRIAAQNGMLPIGLEADTFSVKPGGTIRRLPLSRFDEPVTAVFEGATTIVNSALLAVSTGADFVTAARDVVTFIPLASGWMAIPLTAKTFILPGSASPTPTVAGLLEFGSTLKALYYGDGTNTNILSPRINGPLIATTSGTAIDVTGIPAGVKGIVLSVIGTSTNGNSALLLQIGDSGGIENTGYAGGVYSSAADAAATSGWQLISVSAAAIRHGALTLTLVDAATNLWSCFGVMFDTGGSVGGATAGTKSLTGMLDRFRLVPANGTDAFDLGAIAPQYFF